jgi:hypothetical protein
MFSIDQIAQAAANAAYDAVMALAEGHTAPAAPALPTQAPAPQAAPAQATGTDGAADAFAAFRLAFGVTSSVWRAVAPKGSDVRAQVRAAYVGGFDRQAHKGNGAQALAAFGANVPAMQALAAAVNAAAGVPAAALQAQAAVTQPQAPQAALWGMPAEQAPEQAPQATKPQPTGTVALNGLKRYAKSQGWPIPKRAADVPGTVYGAAFGYVEAQRAQGLPCDADAVATYMASVLQK